MLPGTWATALAAAGNMFADDEVCGHPSCSDVPSLLFLIFKKGLFDD
jgi:hypothetical protein